jgi:hypothetical protein
MTRVNQAKRWWKNRHPKNEWVPHDEIPSRTIQVLRKANLMSFKHDTDMVLHWKFTDWTEETG